MIAAVIAGCGASDGDTKADRAAATADIVLPRGTFPRTLLPARDGSLWISESVDYIAQRLPSGRIVQHRLGQATNTSIDDLAIGPEGSLWFQGFQILGWIPRGGEARGYETGGRVPIGSPSTMTVGPDGNIWFADEGVKPAIKRILSGGQTRVYPLPTDKASGFVSADLIALTNGPDNALWFIQRPSGGDGDQVDGIFRLDPEGQISGWPLPRRGLDPTDLAVGSDGALWFTEQSAYAIGRITTEGMISEFRLKAGIAPFAIIAAKDGALWFSTKTGIGRITTKGQTQTWPVRGAKRLGDIAEARGGGFWVSDGEADRVRFVDPEVKP